MASASDEKMTLTCCSKCSGLFEKKVEYTRHERNCDGTVAGSSAKLFAIERNLFLALQPLREVLSGVAAVDVIDLNHETKENGLGGQEVVVGQPEQPPGMMRRKRKAIDTIMELDNEAVERSIPLRKYRKTNPRRVKMNGSSTKPPPLILKLECVYSVGCGADVTAIDEEKFSVNCASSALAAVSNGSHGVGLDHIVKNGSLGVGLDHIVKDEEVLALDTADDDDDVDDIRYMIANDASNRSMNLEQEEEEDEDDEDWKAEESLILESMGGKDPTKKLKPGRRGSAGGKYTGQKVKYANSHREWSIKYREYLVKGPLCEDGSLESLYECNQCTFRSNRLGFFDRHMKVHVKETILTCDICAYRCTSKGKLNKHAHLHSRPFMCEFCSVCFAEKRDLQRHTWIHTDYLPFSCPDCNYKCRYKRVLEDHQRKHTGELLTCPVADCEYKTCYKVALDNHRVAKHEMSQYECDKCSFTSHDRYKYYRHLKQHTRDDVKNYVCSYCSYRAELKNDLTRHMRKHTREKLYFCDLCDYSASYSQSLRLHLMHHYGFKPWKCPVCIHLTYTKQKMIRHISSRHPANSDCKPEHIGMKLDIDARMFRRVEDSLPAPVMTPDGGGTTVIDTKQFTELRSRDETIKLDFHPNPLDRLEDTGSAQTTHRLPETIEFVSNEGSEQYKKMNHDVIVSDLGRSTTASVGWMNGGVSNHLLFDSTCLISNTLVDGDMKLGGQQPALYNNL